AAAEPFQLRPRLIGPERRFELLEEYERRLDRLTRGTLVLRAAVRRTEREQGPATLELSGRPLVLLQRLLEGDKSAVEIARGRSEKALAACCGCERPGAIAARRPLLVQPQVLACLVEFAQPDQRFDRVRPGRADAGLAPVVVDEPTRQQPKHRVCLAQV